MGHEDVSAFEGSHTLYSRVSERHSLLLFFWFYQVLEALVSLAYLSQCSEVLCLWKFPKAFIDSVYRHHTNQQL